MVEAVQIPGMTGICCFLVKHGLNAAVSVFLIIYHIKTELSAVKLNTLSEQKFAILLQVFDVLSVYLIIPLLPE